MEENIPVVIFCGGHGTRMRGGTMTKKELVEVGGKPVIWHVMRTFSAYSHNHFVLPLGYAGEQLRQYFLNYESMSRDFSVTVGGDKSGELSYLNETEHDPWRVDLIDTGLNTDKASRIAKVAHVLEADRFFVTYGDGVGDVDLAALLAFHKAHGKMATITAVQPAHYQYGTLNADDTGLVETYDQYPPLPFWINAGFMLFERGVLELTADGENVGLETDVLQTLIKQQQLMVYRHQGFWQSMDTLKDAQDLNQRWQQGAPWKVW